MTRAVRSIAGVGAEVVNATGAGVAGVGLGVTNATGAGLAGAVELSKAGGGVELISTCFCGLLHPAISRGKTTTNAKKRQHIPVGNNVSISHLKKFSRPSDQPLSKSSSNSIFSWSGAFGWHFSQQRISVSSDFSGFPDRFHTASRTSPSSRTTEAEEKQSERSDP
jgi:hypothetical protein